MWLSQGSVSREQLKKKKGGRVKVTKIPCFMIFGEKFANFVSWANMAGLQK
jgi:hypothetical protein